MKKPQPDLERWLANEQLEDEDAAEAAFARTFAALPRVEAGAGFVERTVGATLQMRARRRAALLWARAAACIVIAVAGAGVGYATVAYAGAPVISWGVWIVSRGLVGPIVFVASKVEWWSMLARAASGIGVTVATPQSQAALAAGELICVLAVYGLHRLLRSETGLTDSWEART